LRQASFCSRSLFFLFSLVSPYVSVSFALWPTFVWVWPLCSFPSHLAPPSAPTQTHTPSFCAGSASPVPLVSQVQGGPSTVVQSYDFGDSIHGRYIVFEAHESAALKDTSTSNEPTPLVAFGTGNFSVSHVASLPSLPLPSPPQSHSPCLRFPPGVAVVLHKFEQSCHGAVCLLRIFGYPFPISQ
jgi:hypothetical protein